MLDRALLWCVQQWQVATAAIVFYTCLPLPAAWTLNFNGIARFAPIVGILIGICLGLGDVVLQAIGVPRFTASTLVILANIALTGGLHLDGAMDTADGLAVTDPSRRLAVMRDSATGAFGAMAAIAIVFLKIAAFSELTHDRPFALMAAAGWGRWGQVLAIVRYPYLREEGKGALHQAAIQSPLDLVPGAIVLLLLASVQIFSNPDRSLIGWSSVPCGIVAAVAISHWLAQRLGGHTGDTYGAIVEWSEAFILVALATLSH